MIKAAGNIELCELLDVEAKAHCKVCLSYWNIGIVYCTCGHFLRDGTRAPLREEAGGSRVFHREFAQEVMHEETFLGYSRPVHPR